MKKLITILILVSIISCKKTTHLNDDFACKTSTYTNLKKQVDFKKNFRIKLPQSWRISYYYDNVVSSIISADTTKTLTKTTMIHSSFVMSPAEFNEEFISKIKADNQQMGLTDILSKSAEFKNKPMYYNRAKGKKMDFDYQILNVFIKGQLGFIHIKVELYGNELVEERFCKAIDLVNSIEFLDE